MDRAAPGTAHPPPGAPTLRIRRGWTSAAIVGLVAVAALGCYFLFVSGGPFGIDRWWHDLVSVSRGTGPYAVAVFLADAGGTFGAAACTGIAMAALFALRRPRDAAALGFAMLLGVALSELIKALVLRPRPGDPLYHTAGSSYPSGHSMGAAALTVSLLLVVIGFERVGARTARIATLIAVLWIVGMMWGRTALHVHWLSDTLAGAVLGAAVAVLSRRLWFGDRFAVPPSVGGGA